MKTLAYLDCPTGISGDMCLGALVHAGVPLAYLIEQLTKLGISEEFQLRAESVQRNQQAATRVHVDLRQVFDHSHGHHHSHEHSSAHGYGHNHGHQHSYGHSHESEALDHAHAHESAHAHGHTQDQWQPHSHHHTASSHHAASHHHATASRRLPEIEAMILQASFPERVAQWSLATFRTLAKAEATVHGIPPNQVHFHEVGATDAIVDIVGTCLGFDWLNVDALICSALPTGGGTVRCAHVLLPVPAPAVLAMLSSAKVAVFINGINK
ncbi:MAG: LarC family nickel insertion protein, partial [Cyanobacteria bacterium P01_C01_bin.121]